MVIELTNDKDQNLNPYSRCMWILKGFDLLSKINLLFSQLKKLRFC